MRTFLAYLWKEWRDHHAILTGMFVALPALLVIGGLSLPTATFEGRGFANRTALACLAIFVISVSTDLVPGEARRGRLAFLRRQPRGLTVPFLAKLLFFLVPAFVYTACGWLASAETSRAVTGVFPELHVAGTVAWPLAVAVLWVFAVSCCLPRGVLAIPVTAALGLVLLLPFAFLLRIYDIDDIEHWFDAETVALWAIGGIVAAWLAFVRGRRRGGGTLAAARWCGAVALLCILPYWVEAAHMAYAWRYSSEPRIRRAYVGRGGRYAFVGRYHERPGHTEHHTRPKMRGAVLIVDLENGAVREAPEEGSWIEAPGSGGGAQSLIVHYVNRRILLYDARTAERLWDEPRRQRSARWSPELRLARRAASPHRLSDGRRVWIFNGQLECDGPEGSVETLMATGRGWAYYCGIGARWDRKTYFDFARGKFYSRADLGVKIDDILIRPGRWLLSRRRYVGRGGTHWGLLDPDTRTREPARGMEPFDRVCGTRDDGRLFVERGWDGPLVLVDPESGLSQVARFPPTLPRPVDVRGGGHTPGGARVFRLVGPRHRWAALARFDVELGELICTRVIPGDVDLVGCATDDEAIVLVDKQVLARVRFGKDDYEVLYRVR